LKDAYLHDESVTDVERCLLNRRSVGPDRLCVRDNRARTNTTTQNLSVSLTCQIGRNIKFNCLVKPNLI